MAIVRASPKTRGMEVPPGNVLKQTLCLARRASRIETRLEFIQDYGGKTSFTDLSKQVGSDAAEAKRGNEFFRVNILRSLQTPRCRHLNSKDAPDCKYVNCR